MTITGTTRQQTKLKRRTFQDRPHERGTRKQRDQQTHWFLPAVIVIKWQTCNQKMHLVSDTTLGWLVLDAIIILMNTVKACKGHVSSVLITHWRTTMATGRYEMGNHLQGEQRESTHQQVWVWGHNEAWSTWCHTPLSLWSNTLPAGTPAGGERERTTWQSRCLSELYIKIRIPLSVPRRGNVHCLDHAHKTSRKYLSNKISVTL